MSYAKLTSQMTEKPYSPSDRRHTERVSIFMPRDLRRGSFYPAAYLRGTDQRHFSVWL
jgi:hypothetical protein